MTTRYFTPGKTGTTNRVKDLYVVNDVYCNCLEEKQKKYSDPPTSSNTSYNYRAAQIIKLGLSTCVTFNDSLNNVNFLGRLEGQSGGSGTPLRNKF